MAEASDRDNGSLADAGERAWKPITGTIKRGVLVTNNINARDAYGRMSHVWCVRMVHHDSRGFGAFDDGDRWIESLTHYCEIPQPDALALARGVSQ